MYFETNFSSQYRFMMHDFPTPASPIEMILTLTAFLLLDLLRSLSEWVAEAVAALAARIDITSDQNPPLPLPPAIHHALQGPVVIWVITAHGTSRAEVTCAIPQTAASSLVCRVGW
eukprot:CAMPEP_0182863786 /NCGR_PEP_ID=MMETSP0034_2-20130328/6834_1 /TAXON_ID=156128 /ORGANISM="Nephroselmis pyriformis, Strain CCMP717" /LENGTH=115 /DNA_ID=CAMNT_0024996025 /DNA_START=581 /DNA_END=925 /DNA_ORIENTATION=-